MLLDLCIYKSISAKGACDEVIRGWNSWSGVIGFSVRSERSTKRKALSKRSYRIVNLEAFMLLKLTHMIYEWKIFGIADKEGKHKCLP